MAGGNKVFRAWFFQDLATNRGVRDWAYFDRTLAVARARGFRVIATIGDQWGGCDHDGYKAADWFAGGYRERDPAGTVSYRDWAAEIAKRYRNDPTILAWQLINEGQVTVAGGACAPNAGQLFKSWAADVSGAIKAADPRHLVSIGTIGNGNCGAANWEYQDLHGIPTVDLCEYHDYGGGRASIPGDIWNGMQVRLNQCRALGKPLFVGELGIGRTEMGTLADRARALKTKLQAQAKAGVVGVVAWHWWNGSAAEGGDGYQIGPGDPSLPVLGAFRR
jgi:endo-1,4-beta-mannosidase